MSRVPGGSKDCKSDSMKSTRADKRSIVRALPSLHSKANALNRSTQEHATTDTDVFPVPQKQMP